MGIQTFPALEVAGGGLKFEVIASVVVTGTPSSINFTSIDPKYRVLKVVSNRLEKTASSRTILRLNNDTGSEYASGVSQQATATFTSVATDQTTSLGLFVGNGADADNISVVIEQTNLSGYKSISAQNHRKTTTVATAYGMYFPTAVIDEVNIINNESTYTSGTVFLFGSE